jgi:hypothetical protein
MTIRIRVDRVVLDGLPFDYADRASFERGLHAQLRDAFAGSASAMPDHDLRLRRVVADPVRIDLGAAGGALGAGVGRSVHAAVRQAGRT